MYDWRRMTPEERGQVLSARKRAGLPWHCPPHNESDSQQQLLVSAACYEHARIVGMSAARLGECERQILAVCRPLSEEIFAWCVLPNHYHVLLQASRITDLLAALGEFHGRSSHRWNGQDDQRGRKVWHNCLDRPIRSERHLYVSLNYVHHNPVKHGYAARWQDWPHSSAKAFLAQVGREAAEEIWREYPVLDYGHGWDW
jgi:putative transposase